MTAPQVQTAPAYAAAPRGGYDPHWFDILAEVEERHFWFQTRNAIIATVFRHIAGERRPLRVLEAGCGNGNVLRTLREACPDAELTGLDPFDNALVHARRRCDCSLVSGSILDPPFPSGSFEIAGMFDVLEHLPDEDQALKNIHSLLTPGGILLMTVPACNALWSAFDEAAGHYRRYRKAGLSAVLARCGFEPSYVTYFMTTIFPIVWLRRRLARGASAAAELKVHPVLNEMLLRLSRWELLCISKGRRLPIGTSLLAVARKPA